MINDYYVSRDKKLLNIDLIHNYLSNDSYWAKGRSKVIIQKSIKNSICFGVYTTANKQVGFGRVITDYAVFAWLLDVFIVEEERGRGLSKLLMEEIMNHEDLQGLKRWGLNTKDAHSLYAKYGFKQLANVAAAMERVS